MKQNKMKFSELLGQDLEGLICHEEECGLYNAKKRDTCYKLKRSLVIIEVLELRIYFSLLSAVLTFSLIFLFTTTFLLYHHLEFLKEGSFFFFSIYYLLWTSTNSSLYACWMTSICMLNDFWMYTCLQSKFHQSNLTLMISCFRTHVRSSGKRVSADLIPNIFLMKTKYIVPDRNLQQDI